MTRKKVKLTWIENSTARKASLKKRRVGLMKKVMELTILCGVPGMCLIYGPGEDRPTVWPSQEEAARLLKRYLAMPEMDRTKKMMTQEGYLSDATVKAEEKRLKELKKLETMEMTWLMDELHHGRGPEEMEPSELNRVAGLIRQRLQEVRKRIESAGGYKPPGQVAEPEKEEDRKPVLVEMMKKSIEMERRRSEATRRANDDAGVGSVSLELRMAPGGDGGRRAMELFPGGGGGGVKVKEEPKEG